MGMMKIHTCIVRAVSITLTRELATGQTGADKALLSKLRKKTGFPFISCKKALDQFDGDLELVSTGLQAEKWLQEQAQKEGWAKATKLQNRPMSQGLVGVVGDQQTATMVEVNCETDFVARNEKFVKLVSSLALACQEHFLSQPDRKVSMDGTALRDLQAGEGQTLADLVALEVGSVGENMSLRRAVHLRAADNNFLSSFVHVSGPDINTNSECKLGKFGSLLELQDLPVESEDTRDSSSSSDSDSDSDSSSEEEEAPLTREEACRQLGQHVVGMNPRHIGKEEDEPSKSKDEEDKLIFQEFLMNPSLSVKDMLKKNHLAVKEFVRFECGEDLGEDTS
ncbi:elongation factor Ts, mitochondrial-like isoform X2 [Haliotis rufescens]|uniref:elongation factor Ts, mitochondrial-like isoform X2 n=1 Tax=Haliotis rufescens TaxID=6454 RepID=UPI00201F848C|nr:elongation factor Ts, mitochondrial-like isoform X2 [Haliotis rufescens]